MVTKVSVAPESRMAVGGGGTATELKYKFAFTLLISVVPECHNQKQPLVLSFNILEKMAAD